MDDLMERYLRKINSRVSETDIKVVRYLQKVKGSTIQNTSKDLKANYKTITDLYRRLEVAEIVKFTLKRLPTRDGRKMVSTKVFSLTPKFIKVVV